MPAVAPVAQSRFCPSCGASSESFGPGPAGRPGARCVRCGSLERDRFAALLFCGLSPWLSGARLVLDIAPGKATSPRLQALCPGAYLGMDFDPAADSRRVDVQASVTEIPLPDDSVDFLFCYHVLEHVPDDRAAMREMRRVLSPTGVALVQVPWKPKTVTDEDPSASVEERVRRFGQADHVRYYGGDFDDRLLESGLDATRITAVGYLGEQGCRLMGLIGSDTVWVVRAAQGPKGTMSEAESMWGGGRAPFAGLLSHLHDNSVDTDQLKKDAARWELAYRTLRNRPPVRAIAAVTRAVGRLRR